MKKILNSTYVKKKSLPENVNSKISKDMKLFNKIKRTVFAHTCAGKNQSHKGRKTELGINDYFLNAAECSAKMELSSQKELIPGYIENIAQDIESMQLKQSELKKRLMDLRRMKESIIVYTKNGKKDLSVIRNFKSSSISFKKNGIVSVGFGDHITYFDSIFKFEHEWLEPKIRRLASAEKNIRSAIIRKQHKIDHFKNQLETGHYSVCFGGRKLMNDMTMPPAQRKKELAKKRDGSMTLSGRLDAACGNFMVHYIPETGELFYRGSCTKNEYLPVCKINFPRKGADKMIEDAFKERTPKAWIIEDCGNAWRFSLVLTLAEVERKNDFYRDGCIGIDINSGFLAYTETDGSGNPLCRGVIKFPMDGTSSEENKRRISEALEKVFNIAKEKNKPISAEDIGTTKRKADRYSTAHKGNRNRSLFPSALCRQLLESKSCKYGIAVTFVNPAYTSQTGKVKYMARYGMSIHEAASLAIARRGMGFEERLPDSFRSCLEPKPPKLSKPKKSKKTKINEKDKKTKIVQASKEEKSVVADETKPKKKVIPVKYRRRILHWKAAYSETSKLKPMDIYTIRHSEKEKLKHAA